MDFKKNIPEIEKKIRYTFKDKSLLTQAFTRSSFCNEHRCVGGRDLISNEVLEFFGDSVLSTVIVTMMLKEKTERYDGGLYTELDEGDFSNIRSKLSDKRNLSRSMAVLGLQKYLLMGEGDAKLGIQNEPSVMEDLFESIIGAVYVDCGMDMQRVVSVVCGMLDINLYFSQDAAPIQSYKNALQEWCADKKHRLPAPIYRTFSVSGPDHKRVYEREVLIGDRVVAVGKGKNQKLADAAAAEAALRILTEEDKGESVVNLQYLTELKKYAAKNKNPSPEFRDLGETPNSTPSDREYIIECRCMGKCESAVGKSKQEARALAAEKVLSALTQKQSPIKESLKKKPVAKKQSEKIKTNSVSFEDGGKKLPGGKREDRVKKVSRDGNRKNRSSSPKKQSYQHKKHL